MTPRPVVVGTSGHIDHGKTALVRRLTGIDTDRLPEEKARGISIELGFAHAILPSGRPVSFVDVPGHERFVKTMLAGAGGIEAALLVVAADEGVMPQTREHLDIIHFLGVSRGVVALNKCDLVEPELLSIVEEEVSELLAGTTLEGAPAVACSAQTGEGIDRLVATLDLVLSTTEAQPRPGAFRLPVDRVFSLPGFGTVVTGTLRAGSVASGDRVVLLPSGREARVRRVQVHGADVERAIAGERTAVALHGVSVEEIERGDVAAAPGSLPVSHMIDVRVVASPRVARPLANRTRVRYHQGTREVMGRLVLLDREELGPGESGLAQLRLEGPEACLAGDRFVLRSYSPQTVVGGGTVLDPFPEKRRRFREGDLAALAVKEHGAPEEIALNALERAGARGAKRGELAAEASLDPAAAERAIAALLADGRARAAGGERIVAAAALDAVESSVLATLEAFHASAPLRHGMPKEDLKAKAGGHGGGEAAEEALRRLRGAGRVVVLREKVRLASQGEELSPLQTDAAARVLEVLSRDPYAPPAVNALEAETGLDRGAAHDIVETLVDLGRLVKITPDLAFRHDALEEVSRAAREVIAAKGELGVSDLKERLGVSRKYTVPLLEYLDRMGVTRRKGDVRVAGPRFGGRREEAGA